ncbi:hypothetical protein [Actinoallomurus iriomotensis]|uniref:hypothetical protein n=1 Tax=Actinoallomurus iriomotensis TaxID=478107 RepID=UPI0025523CD7|nr:hypothetical protein [Actinoallomurus iriomotensis]
MAPDRSSLSSFAPGFVPDDLPEAPGMAARKPTVSATAEADATLPVAARHERLDADALRARIAVARAGHAPVGAGRHRTSDRQVGRRW